VKDYELKENNSLIVPAEVPNSLCVTEGRALLPSSHLPDNAATVCLTLPRVFVRKKASTKDVEQEKDKVRVPAHTLSCNILPFIPVQ